MIALKNTSIGFATALFSVEATDFELGKVHVLLGKNGIGKSALLNTLSVLISPVEGVINFDGKLLSEYSYKHLAKKIAYVRSNVKGVPFLTADAFLLLGRYHDKNFIGNHSADDYALVEKAKDLFGINHLAEKFTNELSSGELHLCAIAKAYVQQTDYILLDEPTSHLDYANKRKVYELLGKMAKEHNKGIIISTHDLDLAFKFPFDFYLIESQSKTLKSVKTFKEVEKEFM
jgi:iron complex transport system ATP-binding protein